MGEWLNKPWYIHTREYHSAVKRNKVQIYNLVDESPGHYAEWKKTIPKGYTLYESTFVIFLKWQNYRNRKQSRGCQRSGMEEGWSGTGMWWWNFSVSWFFQCQYSRYCTLAFQDVLPLEETESKLQVRQYTGFLLFLMTACESAVISNKRLNKKKYYCIFW